MSTLTAHRVLYDDDNDDPEVKAGASLAIVHPASAESVKRVLEASEEGLDGRSNWVWVRLRNGELILGVFPQGETYMECELDATAPADI